LRTTIIVTLKVHPQPLEEDYIVHIKFVFINLKSSQLIYRLYYIYK